MFWNDNSVYESLAENELSDFSSLCFTSSLPKEGVNGGLD